MSQHGVAQEGASARLSSNTGPPTSPPSHSSSCRGEYFILPSCSAPMFLPSPVITLFLLFHTSYSSWGVKIFQKNIYLCHHALIFSTWYLNIPLIIMQGWIFSWEKIYTSAIIIGPHVSIIPCYCAPLPYIQVCIFCHHCISSCSALFHYLFSHIFTISLSGPCHFHWNPTQQHISACIQLLSFSPLGFSPTSHTPQALLNFVKVLSIPQIHTLPHSSGPDELCQSAQYPLHKAHPLTHRL